MPRITASHPSSRPWKFAKWSFMFSALFWLVVYHLSEVAATVPNFVYVNF